MAVGSFRPIYSQFDPMYLGNVERANLIAYHYGKRLATDNVKDETIERLIADYPSHGFVIDRKESQELFHNIREPSSDEAIIAAALRVIEAGAIENDEPTIRCLSCSGKATADQDQTGKAKGRNNGQFESNYSEVPSAAEGDSAETDEQGKQSGPNHQDEPITKRPTTGPANQ